MTDKTEKNEAAEVTTTVKPAKPKAPKKIVKVSKEPVTEPVVPVTSSEIVKNRFQQSGRVKVIKGSILAPENAGLRFVLNVANLVGKAESPLYPLFEKKWPKVKQEVRGWFNTRTGSYKLGAVNTTAVQSDTWVLNLLCQDDKLVTNVDGLAKCLKEVCKMAKYERATVHVSTLLTQAVPEILDLLNTHLVEQGVSLYFYEEPGHV